MKSLGKNIGFGLGIKIYFTRVNESYLSDFNVYIAMILLDLANPAHFFQTSKTNLSETILNQLFIGWFAFGL